VEGNGDTSYATALAGRGLAVHSFDGHTLKLTYNSAADHQIEQGKAVNGDELKVYAQHVLADLPSENRMFPGLERIEVEFGEI
jgi:hypothetical protein